MPAPHTADCAREPVLEPIRWWPAPLITLAGLATIAVIQFTSFAFSGRPSIDQFWVGAVTEFALFVWLLAWSRVPPVPRVKVLGAALAVSVCLTLALWVEGFAGDGRPLLTWRWTPANETILAAHRERANPPARSDDVRLEIGPLDFPQFRGPDRSGAIEGVHLQRDWTKSPPRLVWRQPVGEGWSSFAVAGEFCITQEQRGRHEAIVCYELRTGAERWEHRVAAEFDELMGGRGPRATPTIHAGRVHALGSTGILSCLEGSDGREVWSRNVLEDAHCENRPFGMTGSPLVVGDLVVVSPGCREGSLAAYDRETGARRWAGGDAAAAYSSPVSARLAGREQILIFNAEGLFAHDQHTGEVLWSYPWITPPELNNVCQPVPLPADDGSAPDRVFISSGYGKGCVLLSIREEGGQLAASPVWSSRSMRAKFTSVVLRDGYVYGLDERTLTCVDLATGKRAWRGGDYGFGQVLLVDDLLLIQDESGDIALAEATPEKFTELSRFPALDHRTWTHPALAGQFLLVRNDREAACYELPVED